MTESMEMQPLEKLLLSYVGGLWGEESGQSEVNVKVMRITELGQNGSSDLSTAAIRSLTKKQVQSRSLHTGDLVLEKSGGGPKTPVGRVALIGFLESETICSNFMLLMRPDNSIVDSKYLHHFLTYMHVTGQTIPLQSASTNIRNIRTPDYMQIQVPVPPLDVQRRIVETLEDHLSRLDKALVELDHADSQALDFRRSILNALLNPRVSEVEHGIERTTSGAWESLTFGDLGKWVTGSTPSSTDNANKGEDVLFVTPGDIGNGGKLGEVARRISNLGADRVRRIKPGSVILVCIGTIGKVAWTDFEITTNQQINTLEVDQSKFDTKFVHWLVASPLIQEQLWQNSTSTTVALINKKTLEKIPCRIPPLGEQRRIVETLDINLSRLESTRKSITSQKSWLATLRRSILNKAFNGELGTN